MASLATVILIRGVGLSCTDASAFISFDRNRPVFWSMGQNLHTSGLRPSFLGTAF